MQQCGTSGFVVADPSSQYVPQAFLQGGTQQDASLAKRERKSSSATAMTISQASLIPITYQTGLASANETLTSGMWQNLAPTNCETMTLQEFTQLINSPAATCGTAIAGGGLFLVGVFGEPLTLGGSTVLVVGGAGLAAFNGVQCATLVANGSLGAQIQTIFKENGYGSSDTFNVCTGPTAFASSSIIVSPINLPATPPPATASCSITVTNVPSQGASINISGPSLPPTLSVTQSNPTGAVSKLVPGHYSVLVTAPGQSPANVPILLNSGSNSLSLTLHPPGTFTRTTGNMTAAREAHISTLLQTYQVLVAGGIGTSGVSLATAELYNPATDSFSPVGNMTVARQNATATLIPNGNVLVAGGIDASGNTLSAAELYNPATASFGSTGSMLSPRIGHGATLLQSGNVLITGGASNGNLPNTVLASAELYHPATGTFTATSSMSAARIGHMTVSLLDGTVLVAGGQTNDTPSSLSSAEIYNPSTGTFTTTGSMTTARSFASAALLSSGGVLIAGGWNNGTILQSAEVFDPSTGNFTALGNMTTSRVMNPIATAYGPALGDSEILIPGGANNAEEVLSSTDLFDPVTATFSSRHQR